MTCVESERIGMEISCEEIRRMGDGHPSGDIGCRCKASWVSGAAYVGNVGSSIKFNYFVVYSTSFSFART